MIEHNSDLPILDELGLEFEAMVSAAWAAEAEGITTVGGVDEASAAEGPATSTPTDPGPAGISAGHDRHTARRRIAARPSRAARERRTQARRIGRRAAILLLLVCLVGGVAFAALRGGGSGGQGHTSPAQLGRADDGSWTFSAYRDGGRLCTLFAPRGGEPTSNCGPSPAPGHVRAGSAIAGGRRYVFGVTGDGVERVTAAVDAGGTAHVDRRVDASAARPAGDRGAAHSAGFPTGAGWFVLDLGPTRTAANPAAPAVVTPFTRHEHRTGPAYVDCSLGVISPACKQRIEAAAAGN